MDVIAQCPGKPPYPSSELESNREPLPSTHSLMPPHSPPLTSIYQLKSEISTV